MGHRYQIGDYGETYRTFWQQVPERYNWAYEVFDRWGSDPAKVGMVWVGQDGDSRQITFRELGERSRRAANALTGLGAKPGDRVFVMLPWLVEWWEIMLGCMRARLVPVQGTTLLTAKDIEYRVNVSDSAIAITDPENVDKVQSVRQDCPSLKHTIVVGETAGLPSYEDLLKDASPELPHPQNLSSDPLVIYFTSGTTGHPKMVLNTHSTYPIGHVATGKFWLDDRPSDLHWTISGHRLGSGCVDLLLRAVEHRCGDLHMGPQGQVRPRGDYAHVRGIPYLDLLRTSHGLPHARASGPPPVLAESAPPLRGGR